MSEQNVPPASKAGAARSIFFLAELPYHELLRKRDPQKARTLEARMQQILGEAVYLHDGRVIDSVGPRMIAVMPDPTSALNAARRSRSELIDYNNRQPANGDIVEPTLVVHSGQPLSDGSPMNQPAVREGLEILRSMQPMQLLVSEPVMLASGLPLPRAPSGELSGVRFYEPVQPEPQAPPPPPKQAAAASAPAPVRKKRPAAMIAAGIGLLAVILGAGVVLFSRKGQKPGPPAATETLSSQPEARAPAPVVQPVRRTVSLSIPDPRLSRANTIIRAVLARAPRFELVAEGGEIAVVVAPDPAKPKTLLASVGPASAPVPLDSSRAAALILGLMADSEGIARNELTSSPPNLQRFAEAARTRNGKSVQSVITADPKFVPALRLGLEVFANDADSARAIQTAQRLLALYPEESVTRRQMVSWQVTSGRVADAVPQVETLLKADPGDADALFNVARLSLSALDEDRFRKAATRHAAAAGKRHFHDADLALAQGKIDAAARSYYEAERADPQNPALALKIGRIAVLRHSMTMAELQLEKLRKLDPRYGYPLLQAYIAAEKRLPDEAEKNLQQARAAATWKDDPMTSSAEIYAILSQHAKVMESLRAMASQGEATLTYTLSNPLLRYLEVEAEYQTLRAELEVKRAELRSALQQLDL